MKLNRISLNTIGLNRIGLNRIGSPSRGSSSGSDRPYIDPEVLASLVAVVKCDGKSNNDPDRAIIKNLVDPDNPFVISNAAYKLNSGYGKYEEDFTRFRSPFGELATVKHDIYHIKGTISNGGWLFYLADIHKTNQTKVSISGLNGNYSILYDYHQENGNNRLAIEEDGVYDIPANDGLGDGRGSGFMLVGISGDTNVDITIKQIPSYQGALVTDGVDDLIVSQKTVQEMLGGSNEITVVSMIHQITSMNNTTTAITNYIRNANNKLIRNNIKNAGKTGIYGYSYKNKPSIINDILGDKNDYNVEGTLEGIDAKFSVEGNYIIKNELSRVAWYWTFIAKRVLTTDEINQVIAYYNLDKYVKPDIYYDVKRQGLSNNTPDADWYLKDFSGNGRDMQLYNFSNKLNSGVGKYTEDFTQKPPWYAYQGVDVTPNRISLNSKFRPSESWIIYKSINNPLNDFKVRISGIPDGGVLCFYLSGASNNEIKLVNGYNDIKFDIPTTLGSSGFRIFNSKYDWSKLVIEQIPDYEGALVFDAVEDYGQYVGDLGLKDYTIAIDRAYVEAKPSQVPIMSNVVDGSVSTPFLMEHLGIEKILAPHSFGKYTALSELNINRFISYQSTYKYNGIDITKGTSTNTGSGLTIGRIGGIANQYGKICLWSLMLFPYTLSEFLLERQLKRYKLGTLYPDMVEFRPIVTGSGTYNDMEIYQGNTLLYRSTPSNISTNLTGTYLESENIVTVFIRPKDVDKVTEITIDGVKYTELPINPNGYYTAKFYLTESPQKISYTIDEYIRYEDIVQPYPAIINLKQDGKTITWGDKLKVGSDIVFVESANLLPELYTVSETRYNGVTLYPNTIIKVEKSMVFDNARTYLKANEPNCILSPNRLRIPNSSYKILGYIPDLTGKGNHGVFNNFAFTEESGVNEDGSIHFDGVDDFITIPTLSHGAKQVLMKVNWSNISAFIYDQRKESSVFTFAVHTTDNIIAYDGRNTGEVYIDSILNNSILTNQLLGITHNITITNENVSTNNSISPYIGSSKDKEAYCKMALFTFMSFDEVSSEDEIKELNDIVGIEGGYVESPEYYWDVWGKSNNNADDIEKNRNSIQDQVYKQLYGKPLTNSRFLGLTNFAFNEKSGYVNNGLVSDGVEDYLINTSIPAFTDFTVIAKRISQASSNDTMFVTKGKDGTVLNCALGLEYRNINGEYTYSFGTSTNIEPIPDLITWCTPTSYNGKVLTKGNTQDANGILIGKFASRYWKGVFYKMMLYSKTIDMLSINMLKNLFERDEIIDLTNPIFKK